MKGYRTEYLWMIFAGSILVVLDSYLFGWRFIFYKILILGILLCILYILFEIRDNTKQYSLSKKRKVKK